LFFIYDIFFGEIKSDHIDIIEQAAVAFSPGKNGHITHYKLNGYTLAILCDYPSGSMEVEKIFDNILCK
jgi:hypothetical protein